MSTTAEQLTERTVFYEGYDPGQIVFDEVLNFLKLPEAEVAANGLVRLLGFSRPIPREGGGMDPSPVVIPLVSFSDLPPERQKADTEAKGTGPRYFNTSQGLAGNVEFPDEIGVYCIDINPGSILDVPAGSKLTQVVRQLKFMARATILGTAHAVEGVHRSYGDADAVRLTMPLHPLLTQAAHGVKPLEGIVQQSLLIRKPEVLLHRVGTATLR